jgi:hypothetical protein
MNLFIQFTTAVIDVAFDRVATLLAIERLSWLRCSRMSGDAAVA